MFCPTLENATDEPIVYIKSTVQHLNSPPTFCCESEVRKMFYCLKNVHSVFIVLDTRNI